jgi:hypothetical protein
MEFDSEDRRLPPSHLFIIHEIYYQRYNTLGKLQLETFLSRSNSDCDLEGDGKKMNGTKDEIAFIDSNTLHALPFSPLRTHKFFTFSYS